MIEQHMISYINHTHTQSIGNGCICRPATLLTHIAVKYLIHERYMSLQFSTNHANNFMLKLPWYYALQVSDLYCLDVTSNKVKFTKHFTRQGTMMHKVEICGPKEKKVSCHKCACKFRAALYLREHLQLHENPERCQTFFAIGHHC